ncbi:MAG: hypothetical protein WBG63_17155 [Phormidesmis sp.]
MSQLSDTLNSNTPDPPEKSEGQSVAAFSVTSFSVASFTVGSSLCQTTLGHKQQFDQHNPYHVQVPLSLFSAKTLQPFTGSALLDSFESDRDFKPSSDPQHLKPVNIAKPSRLENVTQPLTVEGMSAPEPHFSATPDASTSSDSISSDSTSSTSPSSTSPPNASVSISRKSVRDSAAAVGLIDLNDTLLFGGDRHKPSFSSPNRNRRSRNG